jgi:DNA topoisomerase-3
MRKLLDAGRTDILRNFVSNRTRRKFAAFLVWKADEGKVGFEFEPRAKGGTKATVVTAEEPAPTAAKRGSAAKTARAPDARTAAAAEPAAPVAKRASAGAGAKATKRTATALTAAAKKAGRGTAAKAAASARKPARR